jgi:hypothetical protein
VSSTGLVTAVSPGLSTISATARGLSASVEVRVSAPAPPVANVIVSSEATQIVEVTSTIFNGNSSTPNPVSFSPPYSFRMNFGDLTADAVAPSGGAVFVHTYRDVGTFTGTLTITSPFGEVSTATATAVVINLDGTWSTGDLQVPCAMPSSGVRSLSLTQSGTSVGGSYTGPSGAAPMAGALSGRFLTLTDGSLTFTSDTPNSGVSADGMSIGLFSNEPCLKGAPMMVFKRQ